MSGFERVTEIESLENLKVKELMYDSTLSSTKESRSVELRDFISWILRASAWVWIISIACRKLGKIIHEFGIWNILCEILEEETKSWTEPILVRVGILCLILFWGDEYFDDTNGQQAYIQRSNRGIVYKAGRLIGNFMDGSKKIHSHLAQHFKINRRTQTFKEKKTGKFRSSKLIPFILMISAMTIQEAKNGRKPTK